MKKLIIIFTIATFGILESWIISPGKFAIFITFLEMGLLFLMMLALHDELEALKERKPSESPTETKENE